MKSYKWILILFNLVLLLGYFNWMVWKKEQTLHSGELVLIQLAPADPRSLMQGDYMALAYEFQRNDTNVELMDSIPTGYAVLDLDSNHVATIVRLQKQSIPLEENRHLIKYKIKSYDRLIIGADSYFFEEGKGERFQNAQYGGFMVDKEGNTILTGLYDNQFKLILP